MELAHTLSFVSILLSLPCIAPLPFLLLMGHSPSPLAFITLAGIQVMLSLACVLALTNSQKVSVFKVLYFTLTI